MKVIFGSSQPQCPIDCMMTFLGSRHLVSTVAISVAGTRWAQWVSGVAILNQFYIRETKCSFFSLQLRAIFFSVWIEFFTLFKIKSSLLHIPPSALLQWCMCHFDCFTLENNWCSPQQKISCSKYGAGQLGKYFDLHMMMRISLLKNTAVLRSWCTP